MPQREMVHVTDPRDDIFKQIRMDKKTKTIPGFSLLKNDVLVGIYKRPERTVGNIILTEQTRGEDEHQGKAAVVLMKGPTAFISDRNYEFLPEQVLEIGDWVALWVSDGRKIMINGQLCRVVRDVDIIMKIRAPDAVY